MRLVSLTMAIALALWTLTGSTALAEDPPNPFSGEGETAPPPGGGIQVIDQVVVVEQQQPQYVAAPVVQPQPRMQRVPYEEGMPVPEGAQIVTRSRPGLWIPGMIMVLAPWLSSVGVAAIEADVDSTPELGDLYIPVLGPFLALDDTNGHGTSALVFDGLVQTAGLTMFIAGLVVRRKYLVYWGDAGGRSWHVDVRPNGLELGLVF